MLCLRTFAEAENGFEDCDFAQRRGIKEGKLRTRPRLLESLQICLGPARALLCCKFVLCDDERNGW